METQVEKEKKQQELLAGLTPEERLNYEKTKRERGYQYDLAQWEQDRQKPGIITSATPKEGGANIPTKARRIKS
jgi:hypothetical protein